MLSIDPKPTAASPSIRVADKYLQRLLRLGGLTALFGLESVAYCDSGSVAVATQRVEAIAAEGRAPSFQEFVEIVNAEGVNFSPAEFIQLRKRVQSLQSPEFTAADLAELVRTKQEMIADFVIYLVRESIDGDGVGERGRSRYEFVGSGGKYLVRSWRVGADGVESILDFRSYDGKAVRRFRPRIQQAEIRQLDSDDLWQLVNPPLNPIWNSMLLDSEAVLGQKVPDADLVLCLRSPFVIVYQEPQVVDGHSCVVVDFVNTLVYRAPDLNFAVIRRETWNHDPPAEGGYHRADGVTRYLEFSDVGSGLILPKTIVREQTSTGSRDVVTATKMIVNGGVDDSVFVTGVIPDGTLTYDHMAGTSYIQGNTRSIEDALKRVTPVTELPDRRGISMLVWIHLAVIVVLAGWFLVRRYWHSS